MSKTYFGVTMWCTPVHRNRAQKKSTCKTFHACSSDSVKVFNGPPDAESHQFSMQPAGSGEDDQF